MKDNTESIYIVDSRDESNFPMPLERPKDNALEMSSWPTRYILVAINKNPTPWVQKFKTPCRTDE